ncbi:hypothetical protein I3843_05G019000 [Carya illinoinensis]|nr:hypothetical protein I3843_05G019000 [Carya illinoinensis]
MKMQVADDLLNGATKTVSLTVTRWPFQSLAVSLTMSSPIFFGERPSGPIFGVSELVAPTSPPITHTYTSTTCDGSNFGGIEGKGEECERRRYEGKGISFPLC